MEIEKELQHDSGKSVQTGRKFHFNKKLAIILGSICLLLFVFVLIFQGVSKEIVSSPTPTVAEQKVVEMPLEKNRKLNPLVNPLEIDRVESAIRKKMGESGASISPAPEYKFEYKLAPELQEKKTSMLIQTVYGADTCNISTAPSMVSVYIVKNHLNLPEAKILATEYNITGDPTGSLPSPDGTAFDYFFSDSAISQFLKVTEPSGFTDWHRAIAPTQIPATDIGVAKADAIAAKALSEHDLLDKSVLKESGFDSKINRYTSRYEKNYDNFVMIDKTSIVALGLSVPTCAVEATKLVNYIQTESTKDGDF